MAKEDSSKVKTAPSLKPYLILFNLTSCVLWSAVLALALKSVITNKNVDTLYDVIVFILLFLLNVCPFFFCIFLVFL